MAKNDFVFAGRKNVSQRLAAGLFIFLFNKKGRNPVRQGFAPAGAPCLEITIGIREGINAVRKTVFPFCPGNCYCYKERFEKLLDIGATQKSSFSFGGNAEESSASPYSITIVIANGYPSYRSPPGRRLVVLHRFFGSSLPAAAALVF